MNHLDTSTACASRPTFAKKGPTAQALHALRIPKGMTAILAAGLLGCSDTTPNKPTIAPVSPADVPVQAQGSQAAPTRASSFSRAEARKLAGSAILKAFEIGPLGVESKIRSDLQSDQIEAALCRAFSVAPGPLTLAFRVNVGAEETNIEVEGSREKVLVGKASIRVDMQGERGHKNTDPTAIEDGFCTSGDLVDIGLAKRLKIVASKNEPLILKWAQHGSEALTPDGHSLLGRELKKALFLEGAFQIENAMVQIEGGGRGLKLLIRNGNTVIEVIFPTKLPIEPLVHAEGVAAEALLKRLQAEEPKAEPTPAPREIGPGDA